MRFRGSWGNDSGILLGLLMLTSSVLGACTRISPGEVGIKVVNGGTDRGVQDYPTQVGWVFYNPLTTSIKEYPTYVQTAVWTRNPGEGHPTNEEISFTNKDKMLVSVDVNLSYHLDSTKIPAFYVKFRNDDLNGFTYGYLHNTARDAFNEHAGQYSIDEIMGDNATFLASVRDGLQKETAQLGVVIDQFGIIGAPRPPQAVIDQINASVHATQLTTQKQNELAQVSADMAKEREKTDTYARNIRAMAEAQAAANKELNASLSSNLVQYEAIKKWDGVLPTMTTGGIPLINLTPKQ